MRIAYISLALLVLLAASAGAQMDQDQQMQGQAASNATVQPGPQLRPGLPFSADVFVDGRFAMRIPASAGGLSPMRRAQIIADRLNEAFAAGASWQDMRVSQANGQWIASLDGRTIATADLNSARAYGVSEGNLASRWARQSVVAMGGQPQMIAQQLQPVTVAVAGAQQEVGQPPTSVAPSWSASPTRSVPLFDAATGERLGTVSVGGPTSRLNAANAVVLYTAPADGGTAYMMVPITQTSMTGTVTRANGVGVVGVPSAIIPTEGIMMGTQLPQFTEERLTDLENVFTDELRDQNVATGASTAVVPMYSSDTNQVIGAAHIVGNAAQIGRAQAVVVSTANNTVRFQAVSNDPTATGTMQPLNNVVLSGIVLWTSSTPGTPGAAGTPEAEEREESDEETPFDGAFRDPDPNAPQTSTEPGTPGSNF